MLKDINEYWQNVITILWPQSSKVKAKCQLQPLEVVILSANQRIYQQVIVTSGRGIRDVTSI